MRCRCMLACTALSTIGTLLLWNSGCGEVRCGVLLYTANTSEIHTEPRSQRKHKNKKNEPLSLYMHRRCSLYITTQFFFFRWFHSLLFWYRWAVSGEHSIGGNKTETRNEKEAIAVSVVGMYAHWHYVQSAGMYIVHSSLYLYRSNEYWELWMPHTRTQYSIRSSKFSVDSLANTCSRHTTRDISYLYKFVFGKILWNKRCTLYLHDPTRPFHLIRIG